MAETTKDALRRAIARKDAECKLRADECVSLQRLLARAERERDAADAEVKGLKEELAEQIRLSAEEWPDV